MCTSASATIVGETSSAAATAMTSEQHDAASAAAAHVSCTGSFSARSASEARALGGGAEGTGIPNIIRLPSVVATATKPWGPQKETRCTSPAESGSACTALSDHDRQSNSLMLSRSATASTWVAGSSSNATSPRRTKRVRYFSTAKGSPSSMPTAMIVPLVNPTTSSPPRSHAMPTTRPYEDSNASRASERGGTDAAPLLASPAAPLKLRDLRFTLGRRDPLLSPLCRLPTLSLLRRPWPVTCTNASSSTWVDTEYTIT
mmetsp:Transcript_5329/g.17092  ORF Transcript_5329/g.17092 Transcript_5329/m.17092 type:complete len:259 (-) Transcript_5329:1153-1929(-)